jgi:hypothetical protein
VDLMNGLNRSIPHVEVMSTILDILISLAEFEATRPLLASMEVVYEAVMAAMVKIGDKNADIFCKGCSLFWRLGLEAAGLKILIQDDKMIKRLSEFEESQKRKRKNPSSSSIFRPRLASKTPKKAKTLSTKHGCQLTESIVRYHMDPYLAITVLMKKLK